MELSVPILLLCGCAVIACMACMACVAAYVSGRTVHWTGSTLMGKPLPEALAIVRGDTGSRNFHVTVLAAGDGVTVPNVSGRLYLWVNSDNTIGRIYRGSTVSSHECKGVIQDSA